MRCAVNRLIVVGCVKRTIFGHMDKPLRCVSRTLQDYLLHEDQEMDTKLLSGVFVIALIAVIGGCGTDTPQPAAPQPAAPASIESEVAQPEPSESEAAPPAPTEPETTEASPAAPAAEAPEEVEPAAPPVLKQ